MQNVESRYRNESWPPIHGLPKISRGSPKDPNLRNTIGWQLALQKHRCFHPFPAYCTWVLRSPAGAVPRGGAPSHDSGMAQLVPTPIGRTQIFIHFTLPVPSKVLYTGSCRLLCHCASHAPLFFDSLSTDIGLLSAGRLA
jgi:hypothetical protein